MPLARSKLQPKALALKSVKADTRNCQDLEHEIVTSLDDLCAFLADAESREISQVQQSGSVNKSCETALQDTKLSPPLPQPGSFFIWSLYAIRLPLYLRRESSTNKGYISIQFLL
jgi:hypothetical protein